MKPIESIAFALQNSSTENKVREKDKQKKLVEISVSF